MKVKQLRRILSVTLASAMLITSIPVSSVASEEPAAAEETTEAAQADPAEEADAGETAGAEETADAEEKADAEADADADVTADAAVSADAEDAATAKASADAEVEAAAEETAEADAEETADAEKTAAAEGADSTSDAEDTEDAENASVRTETSETAVDAAQEGVKPEETDSAEETVETTAAAKSAVKSVRSSLLASTPSLTAEQASTPTLSWSIDDGYTKEYDEEPIVPTVIVTLDNTEVTGDYTITYEYTWCEEGSSVSSSIELKDAYKPGTYTAVAKVISTADETVISEDFTVSYSITKKVISVEWSGDSSAVYTGSAIEALLEPSVDDAYTSMLTTPDEIAVVVYDANEREIVSPQDAGTYTLQAKAALADDYSSYYEIDEDSLKTTFSVTPMSLTLKLKESSAEYSGSVISPTIYVTLADGTSTLEAETYSITMDGAAVAAIQDAGSYVLSVDTTDIESTLNEKYPGNYTIDESSKSLTFKVDQKAVSFSLPVMEAEYTGSAIPLPEVTFPLVAGGDAAADVAISGSSDSMIEVGEYQLVFSIPADYADNYVIGSSAASTATFTVKKVTVSGAITWSTDELYYDGTYQYPTVVEIKGYSNSEMEDLGLTYTVKDADGVVTGATVPDTDYTVEVTSDHYNFTDESASCSFTVQKVQINSFTWKYNDSTTLEATYSGEAIDTSKIVAEYTGYDGTTTLQAYVYIDPALNSALDADGNIVVAGDYILEAKISANGNEENDKYYEIAADAADVTATFTVNQKEILLTWSDTCSFTYDQAAHQRTATAEGYTFTYTFAVGTENAAAEDGFDWTAIDGVPTEPGTYKVTVEVATGPSDADSKKLANPSETFTIVTYPVDGFTWYKSGEALSGNTTSDVYKNAAFDMLAAKFDLTDDITVEADVKITGYTDPDGNVAVSLPTEIKDAGTYTLEASIKSEDIEKYEISSECAYTTATYTVEQLPITLTADNQSIYYQEDKPAWTESEAEDYSISGLEDTGVAESDVRAALNVTLLIKDTDAAASVDAGTYSIIQISAEQTAVSATGKSGNYSITTKVGSLTIKQLPVTLTIDADQSKVYGEADPELLTYTPSIIAEDYSGSADADSIVAELNGIGTVLTREENENVGSWLISFNQDVLDAAANYEITTSTDDVYFTIAKLAIALKVTDQTKVYGEADPDYLPYTVEIKTEDYAGEENDFDAEAIIAELDEIGTVLERKDSDENVTTDTNIHVIGFVDETIQAVTNYSIEDADLTEGTLTIEKLDVSLAVVNKEKTYSYGDPSLDYTVTINTENYNGEANGFTVDSVKTELNAIGTVVERTDAGTDEGENAGSHAVTFIEDTIAAANAGNYTIESSNLTEGTLTINKLEISIEVDAKSKYYGDVDPTLSYTVTSIPDGAGKTAEDIIAEINEEYGDIPLSRAAGTDVGSYTIRFLAVPGNYKVNDTSSELTIMLLPVVVTAQADQWKYYSESEPEHFAYDVAIGTDESGNTAATQLSTEAIKLELDEKNNCDILQRESGEEAWVYAYELINKDRIYGNFILTFDESVDEDFEIVKLPVTITADAGQSKYYGANDPEVYTYTVTNTSDVESTLEPEEIIGELEKEFDLEVVSDTTVFLKRESGEDADTYALFLVFDETTSDNFAITYEADVFTVKKLPVTIIPDANQQKIFGAKEQEFYTYTIDFRSSRTTLTSDEIMDELGNYVLARESGEAVGIYDYYIAEDPDNFTLTLTDDPLIYYEITTITITSVDSITSRQTSFGVTTDLVGERQAGVTTKIAVDVVSYPKSADGILFSDNIDDYITDATAGIAFTGESQTINVNEVTYQKLRKDTENKTYLSWAGYLPAGTVLRVSIVDGEGNVVSEKAVEVTVSAVAVSFNWDPASYSTSSSTGNYVVSNNGTTGALALVVANGSAGAGEMVELAYSKESGSTAYHYGALNLNFIPEVNNSGLVHVGQSITAGIVDTLNLTCESKTLNFYVDDTAFDIPAASISFANRSNEVSITLPEVGTVTSVTIAGATVAVSGEMGTTFTFPVEWSGENLVTSGSAISVAYTDQAGHQGTGTGTVTKSSVATPITFTMRPALNSAGYLNGASSTLIISGTACACEPIIVTVAGTAQTTYATQQEAWSDENGSWEIIVSMSSLPEGESFTISAEYADVVGTSYSITANYNEYVAEATLLSPVYEAMTHLSGLVEPGTSVALVINGDTQNYYELSVDQYGHFSTDNMPMLFADEDSFDIYVTDIAGNVSILHYEVTDYVETTSVLSPMGKFLYSEEADNASGYVVLPVAASDFKAEEEGGEDLESIELPLLMGASYIVGTFTVDRTENGITVTSAVELDEELIDPEDYSVEDIILLVFTSEPTALELKAIQNAMESGNEEALQNVYEAYGNVYEAAYGEEIELPENGNIWIASVQEMTILTDAIEELELYQYIYDVVDEEEENPYDLDKDHYDDLYKSYQER
ncbi:MAG: hypothetical protein LUI87_09315 [Lachnospiraceae bacterium]|nr:hypothetical protein [Lachnospiraceae bacterium]